MDQNAEQPRSPSRSPSIDWGKVGWQMLDGVRRYWAIIVTLVAMTYGGYIAFMSAIEDMKGNHAQGMRAIQLQGDEQSRMLNRMLVNEDQIRQNEDQIRQNKEALIRIVTIMERIEKTIERRLP